MSNVDYQFDLISLWLDPALKMGIKKNSLNEEKKGQKMMLDPC